MTTTEAPAELTEFQLVPADVALTIAPEQTQALTLGFSAYLDKIKVLREQAALTTTPKMARVVRLEAKLLRNNSEKTHKSMKEGVLRYGRALDGAKNIIASLTIPIEEAMEAIEKKAEREEAERIQKLHEERYAAIMQYGVTSFGTANLGVMPAVDFDTLLADSKALHEARVKRLQEIEDARVANEVAEAKERERLRKENAKLAAEAKLREEAARKEREAAAIVQRDLEAKLAQERAEAEKARLAAEAEANRVRKAELEFQRVEYARLQKIEDDKRKVDEAAAIKESLRLQALADAERQKADDARLAAEELRAEARQEREVEEARIAAAAAATEKAAQAPDKEKLLSFQATLEALKIPEMTTKKGKRALSEIGSSWADLLSVFAEQIARL